MLVKRKLEIEAALLQIHTKKVTLEANPFGTIAGKGLQWKEKYLKRYSLLVKFLLKC